MPKVGSARSQPRHSVKIARLLALVVSMPLASIGGAWGQQFPAFKIVGDGIPESLTGTTGDPTRGRAIVVSRQNTCLLCHIGPFPEEKFQGTLAPDLRGTGARWSEAQLR